MSVSSESSPPASSMHPKWRPLATDKREARGRKKVNGTELVVRVNRRAGNEKEDVVAGVVIFFFFYFDRLRSFASASHRRQKDALYTIMLPGLLLYELGVVQLRTSLRKRELQSAIASITMTIQV